MSKPAISQGGAVLQTLMPLAGSGQNVGLSAASASSSVVPAKVFVARISARTGAIYRVTPAGGGTAVASDTDLPPNVVEYIEVVPGATIDALEFSAGSGGNLNVTWMV